METLQRKNRGKKPMCYADYINQSKDLTEQEKRDSILQSKKRPGGFNGKMHGSIR